MLNLQSHYIEDEKAYSAVQAGRNRVQSMALIHQFLYRDVGNLTSLHIKDYIQELLAHIEDTNLKAGTMVTLEQHADDVKLDIDTVVPLGLIINELVTNAYKYAFEGRAEGHIRVSFTRQPDTNGYLLRVADDGKGMIENPLLRKTYSFGYRMIKAFSEKLEAKLSIDTQQGTIVSLFIPFVKNKGHE